MTSKCNEVLVVGMRGVISNDNGVVKP